MNDLKPLVFVAGSKKDLLSLPSQAIDLIRERLKQALAKSKE